MFGCEDWGVTLLESMNKQCVFLEHAAELAGLSNVKVVRGKRRVPVRCLLEGLREQILLGVV